VITVKVVSDETLRTGYVNTNGISVYYEDLGNPSDPVMFLVCGMAMQLIHWPDAMCQAWVAQGFRVIRFDNRETGLTTRSHVKSAPPILQSFVRYRLGFKVDAEYDLDTLVLDAVGVLDALGVEQAHWVGVSMGGMIAQLAAADYPQRVLSLTSIMSTTNEPHIPGPRWDVLLGLVKPPRDNTEQAKVKASVDVMDKLQSPDYRVHRDVLAFDVRRANARARRPMAGPMHQMAILATGGFSKRLKAVIAPTLVIHGDRDPLVRSQGGRHSAKSIPGAKLSIIPGMGHDLPPGLTAKLTNLVLGHIGSIEPVEAFLYVS